MRGTTLLLASAALLAALSPPPVLANPMLANDEEGKAITPAAGHGDDAHTHAPGQLDDLVITESTRLKAPGEEWFEARAEAGETRFTYDENLAEITEDDAGIGEFEGGWADSEGEYVFEYDEEEDEFAYWQVVGADTLTRGRQLFVQYCASCHGFDGAGYGRSAQHLRPPPRSFHQSTYKFTKVISDYLPSDEALTTLVKNGLDGTPMLPWALSDKQLADIIQYVKSLSPEGTGWRDVYSEISDVVDIGEDPFASDPAAGVAQGRDVYHRIGCYNCHPGYVTPVEINRISGKDEGNAHRDDLTYPKATKSSAFDVQGHYVQILPPDFTFHVMRSGRTAEDVALTVAAGIGGAGMPQWKGGGGAGIPDEEIWAIGYYVRSLVDDYLNQPAKRAAFMAGLRQGN
jgi:mono/diheme cytochrome c family protein